MSWFGVQCSSSCYVFLCLNHNSFDLFGAQLTHSLCLCLSVSPLLLTSRSQVKGTRCSVLFTTQTDGFNWKHTLAKCAKCSVLLSVSQVIPCKSWGIRGCLLSQLRLLLQFDVWRLHTAGFQFSYILYWNRKWLNISNTVKRGLLGFCHDVDPVQILQPSSFAYCCIITVLYTVHFASVNSKHCPRKRLKPCPF